MPQRVCSETKSTRKLESVPISPEWSGCNLWALELMVEILDCVALCEVLGGGAAAGGGMLGSIAGGGVGGTVLMVIVGLIKQAMAKT